MLIIAFLHVLSINKKVVSTEHGFSTKLHHAYKNEFVAIVLCFIVANLTIQCGFLLLDRVAGTTVNRNQIAHFLYIGLNPHSNGQWSEEAFIYPSIVEKNNFDYQKADKEIMQKLKDEIEQANNLTFSFFDNKMKFAWADNEYLYYPNVTMNSDNSVFVKDLWIEVLRPIIQLYYIFVILFLLVGSIFSFINKEKEIILFNILFVFGFALVLLFIEVQPRYKTVVYPFMCIVSAYGFYGTIQTIKSIIRNLTKHETSYFQ